MSTHLPPALDLTPPPFADGLCDWSRGDGTPDSPSYETGGAGRIARNDPDFGTCLELRKIEPVQRLRYMGEAPLRAGCCVAVRVRIKALRGPLAAARIAAWPGGLGGRGLPDLPGEGPATTLVAHDAVVEIGAVIGRTAGPGIDLVWDMRARYAHVGLDLLGPCGGAVRIENLRVCELRGDGCDPPGGLPGFAPAVGPPSRA